MSADARPSGSVAAQVGPVIHGVECYEAWREDTDCPHDRAEKVAAIRDRAQEAASYTGAEETAQEDVNYLLRLLDALRAALGGV